MVIGSAGETDDLGSNPATVKGGDTFSLQCCCFYEAFIIFKVGVT
jgi:hypothetical protein